MTIHTSPRTNRPILTQRAQAILQQRYQLRPKQRVFVLYDGPKERVGKAFVQGARRIGAKVDTFRLRTNRFSPQTLASLTKKISRGNYDRFILIIEGHEEEVQHRITIAKSQLAVQEKNDGIFISLTSIEESMLQLDVDYIKLEETAKRLLGILKDAVQVEVRTSLGTNLRMDITGRSFHDDVIHKGNDLVNFPYGEIYCAPVEDAANGVMIADGSAGDFGLLPQPLRFKIKDGKISSLRWLNSPSADAALLKKIRETLFQDEGASVIGEFGIGLAPYPICGNMLQDEKAAETIHIAFGDNSFFGGENESASHVDFLVQRPTLRLSYAGKTPTRTIMREGKLLIY